MTDLEIIGAPQSNFVRTARIACMEKGIPYTLNPARLHTPDVALFNTGLDPVLVRQYLLAYFFSGLPDGAPDRAKIDAVLPKVREMFALLDRELSQRTYLAGAEFTLADAFLLPVTHYMSLMPETGELLHASPHVAAWFDRVSTRPSAKETEPPPMPGRG